jgi:ActR/RegA family two-component response regulator
VELAYIRRTLDACGGNVSEAARRLGIDRRTLYRRLEER